MFDKMKQMMEMQKKAKDIQHKLEGITIERADSGVKIAINGLFKVESVEIDPAWLSPDKKEKLQNTIAKLFSSAVQDVQKKSAMESQELLKGLVF